MLNKSDGSDLPTRTRNDSCSSQSETDDLRDRLTYAFKQVSQSVVKAGAFPLWTTLLAVLRVNQATVGELSKAKSLGGRGRWFSLPIRPRTGNFHTLSLLIKVCC